MTFRKTLKNSVMVLFAGVALAGCEPEGQETKTVDGPLLYAWVMDADLESPDFLAVIDADPNSPDYGTVLNTVLTEGKGGMAHHTNHSLPRSGILFGNDFTVGTSHIFDTKADPKKPTYKGFFTNQGDYSFPHTYVELPNGNILSTFQTKGEAGEVIGGLVEMTITGEMVRASDASDPDVSDFIRPYSLEILPDIDRVVSTSHDMKRKQTGFHVQIWRLSDLTLLKTIELPAGERAEIKTFPLEPRVLGDGKTVLIDTYFCGIYRVSQIETENPEVALSFDIGGDGCGIPLVMENFWIQPLGPKNQIVVLDISNPAKPFEVSRLAFDFSYSPHWLVAMGNRIAVSEFRGLDNRILMLDFDPATGTLNVDETFGPGDENGPGVLTNLEIWPHGETGPAVAHGMVFRKGEK